MSLRVDGEGSALQPPLQPLHARSESCPISPEVRPTSLPAPSASPKGSVGQGPYVEWCSVPVVTTGRFRSCRTQLQREGCNARVKATTRTAAGTGGCDARHTRRERIEGRINPYRETPHRLVEIGEVANGHNHDNSARQLQGSPTHQSAHGRRPQPQWRHRPPSPRSPVLAQIPF